MRKHEDELRRRANDLLGYRLAVRADHARLFRPAWRLDSSRGATVPSRTLPRDRWQPFTPRHYLVLYLVLSLLEERHSLVQLPLTELAELVCQLGVDLGAPIDFDQRGERKLFVEVLRWLADWGVVRVSEGETPGRLRRPRPRRRLPAHRRPGQARLARERAPAADRDRRLGRPDRRGRLSADRRGPPRPRPAHARPPPGRGPGRLRRRARARRSAATSSRSGPRT